MPIYEATLKNLLKRYFFYYDKNNIYVIKILTVRIFCLDGVSGPDGQGQTLLVDRVNLELIEVAGS
jgi:hypothetical protein